ncbi:nucleoside-diphosphate sugar epimerase/dehydratase [Thermostilla marina]
MWRNLCGLAVLLPILAVAYYISFWLRFEGQFGPRQWEHFWSTLPTSLAIEAGAFMLFRVHRAWNRYVNFYDLVALVQAATIGMFCMALFDRLFIPPHVVPRSVLLLNWGTTVVLVGGVRAALRVAKERNFLALFPGKGRPTALIVGVNGTGETLLRSIYRGTRTPYRVVGFIGRDARSIGDRIGGVPVLGVLTDTCRLAVRHGVEHILITKEALTGKEIRALVDEARRCNLEVSVLPSYAELLSGQVTLRPRPVSINDLLRREPVELNLDEIREWIDGRTLLVTGSAGSIGSEICRQLLRFSPERIVLVDRSETGQFFLEQELAPIAGNIRLEIVVADVLDRRRMQQVFRRFAPEIVFHAAAYKHVPLMESHPGEAVKNIVLATKTLADLAPQFGVRSFVMVSTDKAVNPTSVMGACKRMAEMYVQSLAQVERRCRFVTVRFGNVLDSAGSVVQVFRRQIDAGGPITITDPRMERFFMTIPEAAQLVIQAGVIGRSGEILVLDMGEPVRIIDLAEEMIRLSGLRVGQDIEIEVVGLRPGEKLYEELRADGETALPTRHPKIMIADSPRLDIALVRRWVEDLVDTAETLPESVVDRLRECVPGYGNKTERSTAVVDSRKAA